MITKGGIRAVVFTDSFQVAVMFTSVLIVVLFGVINAGGPAVVFHDASLGGRLIFFEYITKIKIKNTNIIVIES